MHFKVPKYVHLPILSSIALKMRPMCAFRPSKPLGCHNGYKCSGLYHNRCKGSRIFIILTAHFSFYII